MDGSVLQDLTTPGLATVYAMWDALLDIGRLLQQDGIPDAAKVSGVSHILTDRLPPLTSPPDLALSPLPPGSTAADAAGYIYGILSWDPRPATAVFSRLGGEPVTLQDVRTADLRLAPTEAGDLAARPGTWSWERCALMKAGCVPVAHTRLTLLPERLPGEAWEAITAGKPAGEVLEPYGMRRGKRRVCVSRTESAVDASATLTIGDLPVGTAAEHVTPVFCAYVAARAG